MGAGNRPEHLVFKTIGRSNQIKVQSVNDALPNLTNLSSWGPAEN